MQEKRVVFKGIEINVSCKKVTGGYSLEQELTLSGTKYELGTVSLPENKVQRMLKNYGERQAKKFLDYCQADYIKNNVIGVKNEILR